jgi:polyisoprenoid-binding protein YceI
MKNNSYLTALLISSLLLLQSLSSAYAEPLQYTADKWHTRILFSLNHMGLSNYTGRFLEHDIKFVFDEEDMANSSMEVTVPVSSIDTFSPELNSKMSDESFFNTEDYPNIYFKSKEVTKTGVKTGRLIGDLTIKGKTLPLVLDFTFNGKVMHERFKLNNAGFTATGTLDSRAYDVNPLPIWMVGSIINIRIELEAFEGDRVPYYKK